MKQKISLRLWSDSWQNLFECLHAKGTKINSKGNFWAAIQELERQFAPEEHFIPEFQTKEKDKIENLVAEEKY